nr:integrase, catalytic region, zinc finger, CCHC-type, peptidase aspartic, catalytic [Tanacetum cinerariifolium]
MHADLKYIESIENEIDELESDKAEFSNMYDILLQECMSNDVMCSYLHLLSDLDANSELQCLYLHKVKECECLAQKLLKQTEFIVELILFIVDSGCTKHMTGNITINRVYYVEGLDHNLFSVGHFCDADLEVAFRKSTCFVRDLEGNNLLTGLVPHRQKASDYENYGLVPQLQNVSPLSDTTAPSQQELYLLFGPLYDEFFTVDHSLEQVLGNPPKPVQTRQKLATDPEMCMFALTVSTAKPKTIKEVMIDSAWIESMQEELH